MRIVRLGGYKMKKLSAILFVAIFLAVTASPVLAVSVFTTPTEVLQYNPAKAFNGYVLWMKVQRLRPVDERHLHGR
jgi:hypothetical protein